MRVPPFGGERVRIEAGAKMRRNDEEKRNL